MEEHHAANSAGGIVSRLPVRLVLVHISVGLLCVPRGRRGGRHALSAIGLGSVRALLALVVGGVRIMSQYFRPSTDTRPPVMLR